MPRVIINPATMRLPVSYILVRRYTFGSFLLDLFLTFLTGGLWLVWKLFKFLSTH